MVGDYQSYVNKLKSVLAFFFFFLQLMLCLSGQGTFQSLERVTLLYMVEPIIK
jgi:hypothetical protein